MAEHNLMEYAPIGIMFLVAFGFGISQLLVTQLIGPRKRTATKLMPYECGKDPVGGARDRFSIKFYTVAVIFLLFDIEVLFMIPFAVAFKSLLAQRTSSRNRLRHDRVSRDNGVSSRRWSSGTFTFGRKVRSTGACRPVPRLARKQS